jgi:hypothetical protein
MENTNEDLRNLSLNFQIMFDAEFAVRHLRSVEVGNVSVVSNKYSSSICTFEVCRVKEYFHTGL